MQNQQSDLTCAELIIISDKLSHLKAKLLQYWNPWTGDIQFQSKVICSKHV